MKITRVHYERLNLELREPYTIAYETVTDAVNFILKIETSGIETGYGCAAPDIFITRESPEMVEKAIQDVIIPYLLGKDPRAYARLITEIKELLPDRPSALAMVDMALFDLISRKAGMPLYQFLGGYRDSIPTSITVGILPLHETVEKVGEYVDRGFSIIKIKGGIDVEEDIGKMLRLHQTFPQLTFRFDGNQGYNTQQALHFVEATTEVNIEIFEQPVKTGLEDHLGTITQSVEIAVMADESITSPLDALRLAQDERVDMLNVKLMKVGGILEAQKINAIAKSASLELMVGCMDECALGIAAGLHFALSRPNIEFADLDGHLDFLNDPFKGLFYLEKGVLRPNENSGLGMG